jgi:hypothetical protein
MSGIRGRIARLRGAPTGRYRGRILFALAVACLATPGILYLIPGTVAFRASVCATSLVWQSPEPTRLLARVKVSAISVNSGGETWEFLPSSGPYQLSELRAEVPFAARVRYWPARGINQAQGQTTWGALEVKLLSQVTGSVSSATADRSSFTAVVYNPSRPQAPWIFRRNGQEVQSRDTQVGFDIPASRFDLSMDLAVDEDPSDAFTLDQSANTAAEAAVGAKVTPGSLRFAEQGSDANGKPTAPRSTVREASIDLAKIGDQGLTEGQSFTLDPPGITRIEGLRLDSAKGCITTIASGRTHRLCIGNEICTQVSLLEGWMGKDEALDLVKATTLGTLVTVLGAIVHAGVLGAKTS